jgi:uncharacterized protein YdgA (DUF945 family)
MKFVWILAPVGAAFLMSPLVTKPIVMNQIDNAAIQVDKNINDLGLLLERQTEESGFLSSSIVTRIQSTQGIAEQNQEICVDLKTDISHSFTDILLGNMASTTTTLLPMSEQDPNCNVRQIFEDNEQLSEFYANNYGDKSPIIVSSEYGLLGSPKGSFEILPFKIEIPKNDQGEGPVTIDSAALIGNVTASGSFDSLDSYTFDMHWKGFSALIESDTGPIKARIQEMTVEGDQYLAYENIWLGEVNQTFSDLSISRMNGVDITKYSIPSIDVYSNAYEDDNGIQSQAKITLANINENLGDFLMDFSVSNLDPGALSAITKIIDDMVNSNEFQTVSFDGQEEVLLRHAKALIQNAAFDINSIKYTVNNQEVEFKGTLKAQQVAQASFDQIQANPMLLLEMLFFELNGKVNKGFSEAASGPVAQVMSGKPNMSDAELQAAKEGIKMMIDGQLASVVGMGFAVDNGATYNSTLKFDKGMATINGQPIPLPIPPQQ